MLTCPMVECAFEIVRFDLLLEIGLLKVFTTLLLRKD